ncbi:hypothetical protein PHLGIDRAFT_104472 [Phlebiopsis gigantea 11061_1 CR5-6]|uniref:Coenzyme Q-binding protein COQ10 START domain-containing protein n=1 Tax=Phlebiopsis gigantea (strain 11061_1 CR5-6) TaxID=745531 RepID=A0A0C3S9J7_PHLG1|nr:hypothetical protein PHLGIDRAFT_104472 [Phlebiopsis gigantea 11061_1 CR5-6]
MFLTHPLTAARVLKSAGRRQACIRTFFTPPSLPSFFSSTPEEPQTYHERKLFPYRPSQLYNIVSDVASYPKFIPYCTNTRILSRSPPGPPGSVVRMDAEMTARFMAFEASYTSHVTCDPYKFVQAVASSSSPIFKTLTTTWSSLSSDQGPTLVSLDLSFLFAHAAYAGASQMFFGQVSDMMISAFEKRCLELYGPGNR